MLKVYKDKMIAIFVVLSIFCCDSGSARFLITPPCPGGLNIWYCLVRPCSVNTCPAYPDATCVDDYCGGCNAIFSDSSGNVLSDEVCNPPTPCPDLVNCFVSPCSVTTCPAYPDATCVDNYCGGCNAIFSDSSGNVINNADCVITTPCPDLVNCFVSPCSVTTCPAYPDATCVDNYCGGCNAIFSDSSGNVINNADCVITTPCPDLVNCFVSPCSVTTCPAYPDATCVDNYCGGCNAIFSDSSGNVINNADCVITTPCPDLVNCFVSPCSVTTCPAYPDATCVDNYCGGCNAIFSDSSGNVINNADCVISI